MAAPPARTRLGRLGALIVMAPALAALSVALNVSLAAIVYHGALAGFVDRGIALTLLGAATVAKPRSEAGSAIPAAIAPAASASTIAGASCGWHTVPR